MLKEDDLVLGTVEKIEGTTVFVKLSTGEKGTIITSEIAPGRIRNLRDYVMPNKKIVCKILRVLGDRIDLSLRRVTSKEKKEIMGRYKQEQTSKLAIYSILKDEAKKTEEKILADFPSILDFLTKAREKESLIKKYIPKEFRERIKKVTEKKQKEVEVKKILKLKCLENDGIKRIKKIFSIKDKKAKIIYISAGNFQVSLKDENYKDANHRIDSIIENIKQVAKKNLCELEVSEKQK